MTMAQPCGVGALHSPKSEALALASALFNEATLRDYGPSERRFGASCTSSVRSRRGSLDRWTSMAPSPRPARRAEGGARLRLTLEAAIIKRRLHLLIHVPQTGSEASVPPCWLPRPSITKAAREASPKLDRWWSVNANGGREGADHHQGLAPPRSAPPARQVSA